MAESRVITFLKSGNLITLEPSTTGLTDLIRPNLEYDALEFLFGLDVRMAGGRKVKTVRYKCYSFDHKHRLVTNLGFYSRLTDLLTANGYEIVINDLTPHRDSTVFEPQWDRLFDDRFNIELRHGQEEFLIKCVAQAQAGLPARFDCAVGFGKSYLIKLLALILPRAIIHVTAKSVPVLRDRILPDLRGALPDVGMVGGGETSAGHRIQLYTFDSIHRSDGRADILITDECHTSAADEISANLARYSASVNIGLSATHDMRLDNKDMRVEALFGPVVQKVGYAEAEAHGMVVPIEIRWTRVTMDIDPCEGIDDTVEKKRRGLWRNRVRNELIAADARKHPDQQILIPCETLEHALSLKVLLPDFTMVYAAKDLPPMKKRYFEGLGIWPNGGLPVMTPDRFQYLTKEFEQGRLRKVIATTVWNVGVSMNHLEVVCRADGGGSPINDTQIPGRASRTNPGSGKTKSVIYDYTDQFNIGAHMRATKRRKSYESNQWQQHEPA